MSRKGIYIPFTEVKKTGVNEKMPEETHSYHTTNESVYLGSKQSCVIRQTTDDSKFTYA